MDQKVIEMAKHLAGLFKAGLLPSREAQDGTVSSEKENFVQISIAVLKDKHFGKKGRCLYDIDLQICFVFENNDVVVMAPHAGQIHIFYCEWDDVIEGHLPINFLGSYQA